MRISDSIDGPADGFGAEDQSPLFRRVHFEDDEAVVFVTNHLRKAWEEVPPPEVVGQKPGEKRGIGESGQVGKEEGKDGASENRRVINGVSGETREDTKEDAISVERDSPDDFSVAIDALSKNSTKIEAVHSANSTEDNSTTQESEIAKPESADVGDTNAGLHGAEDVNENVKRSEDEDDEAAYKEHKRIMYSRAYLCKEQRDAIPKNPDQESLHTVWRDKLYDEWNNVFADGIRYLGGTIPHGVEILGHFWAKSQYAEALGWSRAEKEEDNNIEREGKEKVVHERTFLENVILTFAHLKDGVTVTGHTRRNGGERVELGKFDNRGDKRYEAWYIRKGTTIEFEVGVDEDVEKSGTLAAVIVYCYLCTLDHSKPQLPAEKPIVYAAGGMAAKETLLALGIKDLGGL